MVQRKTNPKYDEVIDAIERYDDMRRFAVSTEEAIMVVNAKMAAPRAANLSGVLSGHNPHGFEAMLADSFDKKAALEKQKSLAEVYIAWFENSWNMLSADAQDILTALFRSHEMLKAEAVESLAEKYDVSERTIEYRKTAALDRLAGFLFLGTKSAAS
jgi:hypothetical protein